MDSIENLILHLPKATRHLYKKLCSTEDYRRDSKDIQEFLAQQLYSHPYPTLQILKFHPTKELKVSDKVIYNTLLSFLENSREDSGRELFNKFLNYLANFQIKDEWIWQTYETLLPKLVDMEHDSRYELHLSLLARPTLKLLHSYLEYGLLQDPLLSKRSILHKTFTYHEHIVAYVVRQDVLPAELLDSHSGKILIIAKLILQLSRLNQVCNQSFPFAKDMLVELEAWSTISPVLNVLFYDLSRIANIVDMFSKFPKCEVFLDEILSSRSFLDVFLNHTGPLTIDLDVALEYVKEDHILCSKISKTENPNTEADILAACYTLCSICDACLISKKSLHYVKLAEERLAVVVRIMRTIESPEIYIKLMQNIFVLLFLRWEHVAAKFNSEAKIVSSSSEQPINFTLRECYTNGFVCTKPMLEKILNIIQDGVALRAQDSTLNEDCRNSLELLKQSVIDGFWRLSYFENNPPMSSSTTHQSALTIVPQLIKFHSEMQEKVSSDDDRVEDGTTILLRKKQKFKRKPRKGSVGFDLVVCDEPVKEDRSIVARMLGSPLDFALICLSREDVEGAIRIIQKFNLKDTKLESNISFLNNMRRVKTEIQAAIKRYEEQQLNSISTSTIENIKKVAAIGFETSKITDLIERFAQNNRIVPAAEHIALIEKYSKSYPFLEQYKSNGLQVSAIFDLVLNLNMNYEISSNILNVTNRLHGSANFSKQLSSSDQDIYRGVGSIYFFNNMVECLLLFKTLSRDNIGMKTMLSETYYSLRPDDLRAELERENIFKGLYNRTEMEVASVEGLKSFGKSLIDLKPKTNYYNRFLRYVMNLSKLLQLKEADFHDNITEMIKTDIRSIIGEILFEKNISPMDIESIVFSLNLNLVHMIALNISPRIELAAKTPFTNVPIEHIEKIQGYNYQIDAIRGYVIRHNTLLDYVLRQISDHNSSDEYMNSIYFTRALQLPEVEVMAGLYDGNLSVATLLFDQINILQFRDPANKNLIIPIYKIAREKFQKSVALLSLKDDEITKTVANDITSIELIGFIRDLSLRSQILLDELTKIKDSEIAIKLIKSILLDDKVDELKPEMKDQLERSLNDIEIYAEVAEDFSYQTWTAAYTFNQNSSDLIMNKLIKLKKFELCYNWWTHKNHTENIPLKYFSEILFQSLVESKKRIKPYLLKIIESFPLDEVISFYETNFEKFKNLPVLNYVVNYLIEQNVMAEKDGAEDALKYQNYKVSLHIFSHMTREECDQNWDLISRPLLLIEQFVMNSKFEVLTKILNSIRSLITAQTCKFCNDHTNMIYDIPTNSSITLGNPKNSAFLLLNFNLYQKDHIITIGCIDTILQIYATKSLDYRINEIPSSNDPVSLSTDLASLDSLCGAFVMPKDAPTKDNWIKDEDCVQCMCCRRAIFTMLTRRHHCRRCGRVICYSCSINRLKIPNLYDDIPVRVCNDCYTQTQALENRSVEKPATSSSDTSPDSKKKRIKHTDYQLSGNLTHDKLLREEFCYEHAPSAHLCLSILSFHSNNLEYVNLLLHHCRKFEKLLRPLRAGYPNPEIDYGLVAKMLNCLALAAKVRGGPPECDSIRDHSEIIISVVQNGCEALLPMEPISPSTLRKLGDSMVLAEKWPLALDIYLKCGHSTAGVMAAYGLACLRVGRFETARDQLLHCMTRVCKQRDSKIIMEIITSEDIDFHHEIDIPTVKRPNRSPPLLDEIIKVIEATSQQAPVPETLARADSIRNSNSSLASSRSKPKEKIPILEPALNIINTISNLKQISQGNYCDNSIRKLDNGNFVIKHARMFEECLYYLLAYGTHSNIINFLVRQNQTPCALKYFILQNIDNEIFIRNIYVKHLKRGNVDKLIRQMTTIDDSLSIWKDVIIQTCRYLETKNLLNSLYHLQILLNDPIRASMTCVKFYSMNCSNFRDLQNNSFHLINAQKHLQSELEMCQWDNINLAGRRVPKEPSFLMQMDAKTLNGHINTILRQIEVTKFLAKCEQDEKTRRSTRQILKQIGIETSTVPTLFDSIQEKVNICILVLLCGKNIEEGFGLAYRIIQDYNLPFMRIYGVTAKYLARSNRLGEVEKLMNCIISNNGTDHSEYDKILAVSIQAAINVHMPETKTILDNLIKLIVDIETKISCHIFVGQLKSAYLLAVQHNRLNDVKNILRHAEASNQIHIKRLCEKKLNINH